MLGVMSPLVYKARCVVGLELDLPPSLPAEEEEEGYIATCISPYLLNPLHYNIIIIPRLLAASCGPCIGQS